MVNKRIVLISMVLMFSVLISACNNRKEEELIDVEAQEESLKSDAVMDENLPKTEIQEDVQFMNEEMIAFGEKIKEAVASKDMKALEVLLAYPTHIGGGAMEGKMINNTDEFMALSSETVFQKELLDRIAAVDTSALEITETGVVMGAGTQNIIFQVLEGSCYGITEINE